MEISEITVADSHEEYELVHREDVKENFKTSFEEFVGKKEWKDGKWLSLAQSVNGLSIGMMISSEDDGIFSFFAFFLYSLLPLMAVGTVQLTLLYNLWQDTPPIYEDESAFCGADGNRQFFLFCIIAIFITYMMPPLFEIADEWLIIRTANVFFSYDMSTGKASVQFLEKGLHCLAHLIVMYEGLIWIVVFLDGIMYILTNKGVGNIVQAAVAIAFIMDIDNVAVFLYGRRAEWNETTKYRCKIPIEGIDTRTLAFMVVVPVIIAVAAGIVYGLYNTYCE